MSVIVLGMEMPSCCSECELNYDSLGCSAIQSDSAFDRPGFDMDTERLPNCPLRPLPNVHGDLIDRDALDTTFSGLRFNDDGTLRHWDDRKNWCLHGSEVENLITDAPTIVEAEGD